MKENKRVVVGLGLLLYFLARNPRRLGETAALYLQELPTGRSEPEASGADHTGKCG